MFTAMNVPASSPTPSMPPRASSSKRTSPRHCKVGEIDNRGSHFYLTLYWAENLAEQTSDEALAEAIAPVAKALAEKEETIAAELLEVQGSPVDLGGYYYPNEEKISAAMRPSATLNEIISSLSKNV